MRYNDVIETDIEGIDTSLPAPEREPHRQYYFIKKLRGYINALPERPTACVVTFGCQMNAKDSEKLIGILDDAGFNISEDEDSDLVVYNTCSVRDNANQKVYGKLGYLKGFKKKNPDMRIAMCGCMTQESVVVEKLEKSYPFVDLIFGTHNIYRFPELLYRTYTEGRRVTEIWDGPEEIVEELPADRKYSFKSGVNIMYGCDNFCSYCIVPYVRGRERSREPKDILREVERLAADGVVEVMLLGQNVNSYGKKLAEPATFAELLREVCRVDGIERVRFMTSHPKDLSDELIEVMATEPKICRHLHLPLQSGSSRLLSEMNRHYDKEQYIALAERIRERIPDIALTTDIIVGYPGETEEDFSDTMDVVERVRYNTAFTFIYSPRTGTPAAKKEPVPEDVTKERFQRLLKRVQDIGQEESARLTGSVQKVLVEQKNEQDEGLVTGRLSTNETVHFPGDESLIGRIVDVKLSECRGFYFIGEMQ